MPRSAGPLPVSPALARAFGLCRALREVATATGDSTDLPYNAAPHAPTMLFAGDVADVERQLGARLPDELLAVMASHIPYLDAVTGLRFEAMVDVAARASKAVPPAWIALSELPAAPLDPGASDALEFYLCVPRERAEGELRVRLWAIDEGVRGARPPVPFADFLRGELEQAFGGWERWPDVLARADAAPSDPELRPTLEGQVLAPEAAPTRRVRHKAYGEGTVVGDAGDGKLHVEFDSAGRKVILASFLTDV